MSKVIQILNQQTPVPDAVRYRVWARIGEVVSLGAALSLQINRDHMFGEWCLVATIFRDNAFFCEVLLTPGAVLDLSAHAGMRMYPRAYEHNAMQQPERALLEFVAMTDGARAVLQGRA